jgi:hypothetical protein
MLRVIAPLALILFASPAFAQVSLTLDAGGGDNGAMPNSRATVTEQDTTQPPDLNGGFAPATVLTAVNVRSAPSTSNSEVIGTLQQGGMVTVRCHLSWCELQDGGYVAQKFLTFDNSGSFDVVSPPADGVTTAGNATTAELAAPATDATAAPTVSFDGAWTITNDPSGQPVPLTLIQTGATVTGTLSGKDRITQITGDIQGTQLSFTYKMANAKGALVATGNGFLALQAGGNTLTGNLMLNGLVISNINATR